MDTERDKNVLRVVLSITHSHRDLDELGIDSDSITSDRKAVFGYSELYGDATKEAETIINNSLHKRLKKCSSELKQKINLLTTKIVIWSKAQTDEFSEEIDGLNSRKQDLESMIANDEKQKLVLAGMLKRARANIVKERRLKMRRRGGGRKRLMDEDDEQH
eukprot:gene6525-11989_t